MENVPWPYELKPLSWGAESNLYISEYMGMRVVVKHRILKKYMDKRLALQLRKTRTAVEARLLLEANLAGVKAPLPLHIDADKGLLVMEYIEGELLRTIIERGVSEQWVGDKAREIGGMVALLHNSNIVHGDLTTSNVIVMNTGELCLIDFGLAFKSNRVEDKAVDIRVLERAVESTHPSVKEVFMEAFIKGYESYSQRPEQVLREYSKLSLMGRYVSRRRSKT